MVSFNGTCNATLDDLRIGRSEGHIVGTLTFHQLGLIIAAACALIAILLSLYLIWMHALHYTKPYEQRHIIRILFMIPIYAAASFLSFWYYWHAIYWQVISDCYEAFAIASFFALLCHYIAPNLHEQKKYFRRIEPRPWVIPVSTWAKCCGGQRGPWRTPRSGLTWFNIIWAGIYQYCFIRVTMTITAVVTQYFGKYCESSNSPLFAHIWILVIEGTAVSIAMYMVIQFYLQTRLDLKPYNPFLKVLAIKLVIFLSFWQSFLISILTSSTFNVVRTTSKVAYPDLKVGVPSLLLCIEMMFFAILHLFAFPWKPYASTQNIPDYPMSPTSGPKDVVGPKQGGVLGWKAFADAMNPWDLIKAFARGMRWLFIGVKNRENDISYKAGINSINDLNLEPTTSNNQGYKRTESLPIADEFRRSKFGLPGFGTQKDDEGAGLIAYAQPNPVNNSGSGYVPASQRYDKNGQDIGSEGRPYDSSYESSPDRLTGRNPTPGSVRKHENPLKAQKEDQDIGMAISVPPLDEYQSRVMQAPFPAGTGGDDYRDFKREERRIRNSPTEQWAASKSPIRAPSNAAQPSSHSHVQNELWGADQQENRKDTNEF